MSATRKPVYYPPVSTVMENPFQRLNLEIIEMKMTLRMLLENQSKPVEKSDLIGLKEACDMLRLSSSSIYKMTAKNTIPVIKREGSKKLLFSRSKLQDWITNSQANFQSPLELVDEYLHKKLRLRKVQNN